MNNDDLQHFKNKLTTELGELEETLQNHGRKIDSKGDWIAVPPVPDTEEEDPTYQADMVEELENNVAVITTLEGRYYAIKAALDRIDAGTYGICEVMGQPIERERLEANPAATTCMAAMEEDEQSETNA